MRVGEGVLEVEQVADLRAAEAVDALVGVADDADVAVRRPERDDELVLGAVGVLVLVDEHVHEAVLVALEHIGVARGTAAPSRTTGRRSPSRWRR